MSRFAAYTCAFCLGIGLVLATATLPAQAEGAKMVVVDPSGKRSAIDLDNSAFRLKAVPAKAVESPNIKWNVYYEDIILDLGFYDPSEGAARRARLEEALMYLGGVIDMEGTLDLLVGASHYGDVWWSYSYFCGIPETPGFHKPFPLVRLETGQDQDSLSPDLYFAVNFSFFGDYYTGTGNPPEDKSDFQSCMTAVVLQCLGLFSASNEDGSSFFGNNAYMIWDQYLRYYDDQTGGYYQMFGGNPPQYLRDASNLTSNSVFYSGPIGTELYAGSGYPPVYAPSPWDQGRSLCGFDGATVYGAPLNIETTPEPGAVRRTLTSLDIGTLMDVGYVISPIPRILLVGDGWAADSGVYNELLAYNVLGDYSVEGSDTVIAESTAQDWSADRQDIQAALDANPTIDIVHLVVGGQDLLDAMENSNNATLNALVSPDGDIDKAIRRIVNFIIPGDEDEPEGEQSGPIKVLISGYDYVDYGNASEQAAANELFVKLGDTQRAIADDIRGCFYVQNHGLAHYNQGIPGQAGRPEFPGQAPCWCVWPGEGQNPIPAVSSAASAYANDEGLTPSAKAHRWLFQNAIDEYYGEWLRNRDVDFNKLCNEGEACHAVSEDGESAEGYGGEGEGEGPVVEEGEPVVEGDMPEGEPPIEGAVAQEAEVVEAEAAEGEGALLLDGQWTGYEVPGGERWTLNIETPDAIAQGPDTQFEGTFVVRETASPAEIDFDVERANGLPTGGGYFILGILKLEGDTLTMAIGDPGTGYRPAAFEEGENMTLIVFQRGAAEPCDDAEVPELVCRNARVYLDLFQQVSITAAEVTERMYDPCGGLAFGVTPSVFDCDDLGENTVTVTVIDRNGNEQSCNATVTVLDAEGNCPETGNDGEPPADGEAATEGEPSDEGDAPPPEDGEPEPDGEAQEAEAPEAEPEGEEDKDKFLAVLGCHASSAPGMGGAPWGDLMALMLMAAALGGLARFRRISAE